jgi:ATP sulfurylase
MCQAHVEHCDHGREHGKVINGTDARRALMRGEMLPDWHMRESVSRLILEELEQGGDVFVP